MLDITTINLLPDAAAAIPELGSSHVGVLEPAQIIKLLENFRALDPLQNHDADPRIVILSPAGKFIVRTSQQKLLLYNARDTSASYSELDAVGIVNAVTPQTTTVETVAEESAPRRKTPHRAIAVSILVAGLALNTYTLYAALHAESINKAPLVVFVSDQRELTALRDAAAGKYLTGESAGDRGVEIIADGHVNFFRVTAGGQRVDSSDTFRVARRDSKLCLVTRASGVIDITNIDSVVFYHDEYRRTK